MYKYWTYTLLAEGTDGSIAQVAAVLVKNQCEKKIWPAGQKSSTFRANTDYLGFSLKV